METTNMKLTLSRTLARVCLVAIPLVIGLGPVARAELLTFQLRGHMIEPSPPDFAVGDAFVADYTFDTASPPVGYTNGSWREVHYSAITSWHLAFDRGYSFRTSLHSSSDLLVQNDFADGSTVMDRYVATLSCAGSVGAPLPSGRRLDYWQLDFQDYLPAGNPDMLSNESIQTNPPSLPSISGGTCGRLMLRDGTQPFFLVDSLTRTATPADPPATGNTLISVRGDPNANFVLDREQMLGLAWSQTVAYSHVAIDATLRTWTLGGSGTAYLTRRVGSGTTAADQLASAPFSFPASYSPVRLFSGLDLPPGTYYLTLAANAPADGLWNAVFACTSVIGTAPGVALVSSFRGETPNPYPPSSPMFFDATPNDWQMISVTGTLRTNRPPVARCKPVVVPAGPACNAAIKPSDLDDGSFDPDADPVTLAITPAGPFGLGAHPVTLTVTDSHGSSNSCVSLLRVADKAAPMISHGSALPSTLWPPNHKLIDVLVDYDVADACGPASSELKVACNEPALAKGAAKDPPDFEILDPHHLRLRAERSGNRAARVYTITISCRDIAGNVAEKQLHVNVPRTPEKEP
jgi:hypothetical protein